MNLLSRNRIVMAGVAVAAIVVGMLLSAAAPPQPAPASSATSSYDGTDTATDQAGQFSVREYSEFGGPASDLPSSDWLGLLAGMVLRLMFVIALIYLAVWVLRRYMGRGGNVLAGRKKPIFLMASLNLSQNRSVYVLEVARKVLVVGGTSGQLSLLTEVNDPDAIDEMRLLANENPAAEQFSSLLGAFKRRFGDKDTVTVEPSATDPH